MEYLSDIHPAVLIAWLTVGTLAIVYFLVRKFIDLCVYEESETVTYEWNKEYVVGTALKRLSDNQSWGTPEDLALYERLYLATLAILEDPKVEEGPGVESVSVSTSETQVGRDSVASLLQVSLKALEASNTAYKQREVRLHGTINKLYNQLGLTVFLPVGVGNANAALDEVMTVVAKLQAKVAKVSIEGDKHE